MPANDHKAQSEIHYTPKAGDRLLDVVHPGNDSPAVFKGVLSD